MSFSVGFDETSLEYLRALQRLLGAENEIQTLAVALVVTSLCVQAEHKGLTIACIDSESEIKEIIRVYALADRYRATEVIAPGDTAVELTPDLFGPVDRGGN